MRNTTSDADANARSVREMLCVFEILCAGILLPLLALVALSDDAIRSTLDSMASVVEEIFATHGSQCTTPDCPISP